jgi:hypothetical protein
MHRQVWLTVLKTPFGLKHRVGNNLGRQVSHQDKTGRAGMPHHAHAFVAFSQDGHGGMLKGMVFTGEIDD